MANPCVPWFGGYSASVNYYMSGALYIGYTPYPRSNVEHYWWSEEHPKTQWAQNSQFAGSASADISWGLYQTTIPSTYGQFNYWTCSGKAGNPGTCCPQLVPGVSYNSKMLIVWDSYNQGLVPFGPGNTTPIFWLTSASGMAPGDDDYQDYGSYPFGHFSEVIADICPWNYTQSITESVDGDWNKGVWGALWTASNGEDLGGIIILKNNDVRGVDLFQSRQRWNPRLYNCFAPFDLAEARKMFSLTPMASTFGTPSPFDDPYTYKPWLNSDFTGWNPAPSTTDSPLTFSYDPINEIQTSESFHYPITQPYGWDSANAMPSYNYNFEQQTHSMTIELLIKPTMNCAGINMANEDGLALIYGADKDSPFTKGNWMPLVTKWGYLGEYSVYVDTVESKSIAFGYNPSPGQINNDRVWFASRENVITNDSIYDWNQWMHVAITRNFTLKTLPDGTLQTPGEQLYDTDVFKWYINGEPVDSASLDDFNLTSSDINADLRSVKYAYESGSYLWQYFGQRLWYSGSMGFARIYDRALNQYQIKTNFLRSGIWTDFQGYSDEIDFIYNATNPQTGLDEDVQVKYVLNGGVPCSLQVMFDHGNLVSDHGMGNTTSSLIRNIRQYSSSFDGAFSGSNFGGGEVYVTDLHISQSDDNYQTYDPMNGARFFPGSENSAKENYAYMHVDKVSTQNKEGSIQVLEMWIKIDANSIGTGNPGYAPRERVIFCNGGKNDGWNTKADADWGIMYDSKGIGFWDGDIHYGLYYSQAGDYVKDRWCYLQAVFNIDGWSNDTATGLGRGMILGLNGRYWTYGTGNTSLYLQTMAGGAAWNNVNNPWFGDTSGSLYFMGHWEGSEAYNASGSIAEIRFYNTHLQYTGSASYAFGPDWGSGCQQVPLPCTESLDANADSPYDWLIHNWNASKVRFGMGGDSSFT